MPGARGKEERRERVGRGDRRRVEDEEARGWHAEVVTRGGGQIFDAAESGSGRWLRTSPYLESVAGILKTPSRFSRSSSDPISFGFSCSTTRSGEEREKLQHHEV